MRRIGMLAAAALLLAAAACGAGATSPSASRSSPSPAPAPASPTPSLDPVTAAYYQALEKATSGIHRPTEFDQSCYFTFSASECRTWAVGDKTRVNQMLAAVAAAQPPPALAAASGSLPGLLRALLPDDDALVEAINSQDQARVHGAINQLLKDGAAISALFSRLDPDIDTFDVP